MWAIWGLTDRPTNLRQIVYIAWLVVSAIYVTLGRQARRRSIPALGAAIGLVSLEAINAFRAEPAQKSIGFIIGAMLLVSLLGRAIVAIRQLQQVQDVFGTAIEVTPNPSLQRTNPG